MLTFTAVKRLKNRILGAFVIQHTLSGHEQSTIIPEICKDFEEQIRKISKLPQLTTQPQYACVTLKNSEEDV